MRGVTFLPGAVAHFDVTREKSVLALEAVMISDQNIFLVAQKDAAN
jgi:ATP-dependent Lon protease